MPDHQLTRNRLLAALAPEDYEVLRSRMERVRLPLHSVLVEADRPIRHVVFPESGIISTLADTEASRIEVGLIGSEGLVGVPVLLGVDRGPLSFVVQSAGEGLRVSTSDLRAALALRPSIFGPLGRYTQALLVQTARTAYVNGSFGVEARLARWLLMAQDRLEEDTVLVTHDCLSAMLGVRRPGVTLATHVLEGTGAIRARRGRIEVRDREKLLGHAGNSYGGAEREYERLMMPEATMILPQPDMTGYPWMGLRPDHPRNGSANG